MLNNIKSTYFIKILFLFVDEKQKLKIIKYNKNLQKNIDISIINYKLFTEKEIVFESNGVIKEYNVEKNALIFEGEYLNGKRHGKGKEYHDNGNLKYEGEYINGQRNGKGKEYDSDGSLSYEGEYLNGKRHRKGKEYICNKIRFEGEYFNNKQWIGKSFNEDGNITHILNNNINGKGKEYNYGGIILFEGEYLNGKRNGYGKEYTNEGKLLFEGEYKNDLKWNGKGYDSSNNIVYELKEGKGLIKENLPNFFIMVFSGEYLNGKRHGKGKEYNIYNRELEFEGEYLNGKRNGKRIL